MDLFLLVKTLHILSSTILFGTGLGIAFINFWGQRQALISDRYLAARITVLMDFLFTLPAVIVQPLSGYILVSLGGYDLMSEWLKYTYILYFIAGLCWLPVVWIQIRIKSILKISLEKNYSVTDLPREYHLLMRIWFMLGWPAFIGLLGVFWLMVTKVDG